MKRLCLLLLCLTMSLSGCTVSDYLDIENRAIVSAIGLDRYGDGVLLTIEIVNTIDDEKQYAKPQIISENGLNVAEAINNISASLSKNLFYSHCGIIALGEGLLPEHIEDMMNFCFNNNEITLLLKIVCAKNAKELLSVEPASMSISAYEIMSILDSRQKNLSIGYKNSFITVQNNRATPGHIFSLPFFSVETIDDKEVCSLSGVKVFEKDEERVLLDRFDGTVYEMLDKKFNSGQVTLKNGEEVQSAYISKNDVKINFKMENGRLIVRYHLSQKIDRDQNYDFSLDKYEAMLEHLCNILIRKSQLEYECDIFALKEDIRKRDQKLYKEISDNFMELYKNADFKATVDVAKEG